MHTLLAQSQLTVQDQGTKGCDRASNQSPVGVNITSDWQLIKQDRDLSENKHLERPYFHTIYA